jgi:hypothetical protein
MIFRILLHSSESQFCKGWSNARNQLKMINSHSSLFSLFRIVALKSFNDVLQFTLETLELPFKSSQMLEFWFLCCNNRLTQFHIPTTRIPSWTDKWLMCKNSMILTNRNHKKWITESIAVGLTILASIAFEQLWKISWLLRRFQVLTITASASFPSFGSEKWKSKHLLSRKLSANNELILRHNIDYQA